MKLSAVVITKNEEKNIEECLMALTFADEIVVVDSGSSDRTIEVASKFTKNVFSHPFENFGAQKNFALSCSFGEWILFVDADERVSEDLRKDILAALNASTEQVAYRIRRKTYFTQKRLHFSGTQDDRPVRLFRRGSGRFEQPIHEFYKCEGPVGDLSGPLIHHTTPTTAVEISKTDFYTNLEARFLKDRNVKPGWRHSIKHFLVFLNLYFRKLGLLDGMAGLRFAYFSAIYSRRKYQKLNDLIRQEALEPMIQARFDDFAKTLPDYIDRLDSRLNALLEACAPVRGKKVLEVGCGKGRFVEVLRSEGAQVAGVDPSGVLLDHAQKLHGGIFLQASASQLPFEDGVFDVVYTVEVIGHLPLFKKSVEEMFRVLKRGGSLIIVDRNRFSLSQKRFLAPNFLIKRWHEFKDHWIYPKGFPFKEKWFSKQALARILHGYCVNVAAFHIESDGEKKCLWHILFDKIPMLRAFILWKGVKK